MNNAILFFFNISALEIKKLNNNYYFSYLGNNYVIYNYERDINEVLEIYYLNLELLNNGIIGYEIILTKDKEVLFSYGDRLYALMKFPNIRNRTITYEDIINFSFSPNMKIKFLDKSNWGDNWANKIDFTLYQFDQVKNKYPIIEESIDYFIGLWENAISYFNDNAVSLKKYICHKRITYDMDLLEFFNPFNFVIDYKERDMGEYLKLFVLNNNFTVSSLDKFFSNIDRNSAILLISRVLFPSYYFDLYEDIVIDKKDESSLNFILQKKNNILYLLEYIYNKSANLNIVIIDWIKKEISLH